MTDLRQQVESEATAARRAVGALTDDAVSYTHQTRPTTSRV
jgi:hypothetical protein